MVGTFCLVQMYGCGGKWWPFMLPSLCALFPALFRLLSLALSLVLAAACDPNVTPPHTTQQVLLTRSGSPASWDQMRNAVLHATHLLAVATSGEHMALREHATPSMISKLALSHCAANSTCRPTWLVAGNRAASDIVVFMHTTGNDFGWYVWYKLFAEWEPPFYAVALDVPGDITVPATPIATACEPPPPYYSDSDVSTANCTAGYEAVIKYIHLALQELTHGGKRLILVGHSAGAAHLEDYIYRGLQPQPVGLVYISNPTTRIWIRPPKGNAQTAAEQKASGYDVIARCTGLRNPGGCLGRRGFITQVYCARKQRVIQERRRHGAKGHPMLPGSGLGLALGRNRDEQRHLYDLLYHDHVCSPNMLQKEVWHESQIIGSVDFALAKLPPLALPHTIIYSRHHNKLKGTTKYAWANVQQAATEACQKNHHCRGLVYIDIPPFMSLPGRPSVPSKSDPPAWLWGHWPWLQNATGTRAAISEFHRGLSALNGTEPFTWRPTSNAGDTSERWGHAEHKRPRRASASQACEQHGGIINSHGLPTCCPKSCGQCGGRGCEQRPGGSRSCCGFDINRAGHRCEASEPPCIFVR